MGLGEGKIWGQPTGKDNLGLDGGGEFGGILRAKKCGGKRKVEMLRDHKVGVCEEIRGQGRCGRWRRCEVLEDHRAEGV